MPSSKLVLAATIAAIHSFAFADEIITPGPPTPTLVARGDVADGKSTPIMSTIAFAYTDLPHQVYPYPFIRGPQAGYNDCTKQGDKPDALCQSLVVNSLSDFCLWGSPETNANGSISNDEAKVVAYCTQPGHGARVIPKGMITGAQFMKTSGYIQVVGHIKNAAIGLADNDFGGELDPHGADLQGNPIGGVVYSNGTIDSSGGNLAQAMNWNMFVGNGLFCVKLCYNSITNPDYCQNRYDLVGCDYNMPNSAPDNQFTSCEGEPQDPVGIYTGTDGKTTTWSMPDPLTETPPYTPRVPSSSNCQTFASTDLFNAAPTATIGTGSSTTPTSTTGSTTSTTGLKTSPSTTGSKTGTQTQTQTSNPGSGFIVDVPLTGLLTAIGFVLLGGRLL